MFHRVPQVIQMRLRCQLILTRLRRASDQWKRTLERFDDLHERDPDRFLPLLGAMNPGRTLDDWRSWFYDKSRSYGESLEPEKMVVWTRRQLTDSMHKEYLAESPHRPKRTTHFNRRIIPNAVELHVCSFCHNPSASLKKCTRCRKTRFVVFTFYACIDFDERSFWE